MAVKVGPADHASPYYSFVSKEIRSSFPLQNKKIESKQHVTEVNSLESKQKRQ